MQKETNEKILGQLKNVSYQHANGEMLFENIHLSICRGEKIVLIGNNGSGKSTLLKILAGILSSYRGSIYLQTKPYYIPQLFGQFNNLTIAQTLQIDTKLHALHEILNGNAVESNFTLLDDDWNIETRCNEALRYWHLDGLDWTQKLNSLSGGEKTKVFLSGISIHQAEFVLMDEPSNHLDSQGRQFLYNFIRSFDKTLLVVSHDRTLLNQFDCIHELSKYEIKIYGGNYEFYCLQKELESNALNEDVKSREKALRKAKETKRETLERQQRQQSRGKKNQTKSGLPPILLGARKSASENSAGRLKGVHTEKIDALSQELNKLRKELPETDTMKLGLDSSKLYRGKVLISAMEINFSYNKKPLWRQPLSFQITSGDRIAFCGANGSGKTTLIKLILGELPPSVGTIIRAEVNAVYIDQDYSLISDRLTVYQQAQFFNQSALLEHEVKIRLSRFLFFKNDWETTCGSLSGGEKMRLMLCCLTINNQSPDIIILDEPTNNLDIQNIEILTAAINEYQGTLIAVSHDQYFLEQIQVENKLEII